MSKASPTSRSLDLLRKEGWLAAVVEKWNAHAQIRQDLFGIIDILAIRNRQIIGIQATSGSNVSARITKALGEGEMALSQWLGTGASFEIWGWRKIGARGKKKTWQLRRVPIADPHLIGTCVEHVIYSIGNTKADDVTYLDDF